MRTFVLNFTHANVGCIYVIRQVVAFYFLQDYPLIIIYMQNDKDYTLTCTFVHKNKDKHDLGIIFSDVQDQDNLKVANVMDHCTEGLITYCKILETNISTIIIHH